MDFQFSPIMLADSGKRIAVMTNSDSGLSGLALANYLVQSIAKEYPHSL